MEIKNQIIHIFNSSIISGPETLVIPSLGKLNIPVAVIFLTEKRRGISNPSPAEYARSHGLIVYEIEVQTRFDPKAIIKLRNILTELKTKIIHSHDVKASTYSLLATLFTNMIRISTHHGIHGRPDFKTKLYERFYAHFILKFFHAVITVSTSDYNDLIKIGLQQTKCIFNGVTKSVFEIQVKEPLIIAVVGRLSQEKRCDRVLKIATILQKNDPTLNWKLQFFGIGNEEQKLKELSKILQLENRVEWMGYKTDIMQEMKKISILMSMSDAEGMPISIIEAGWAGLSVFATAVGGIQDLIPDQTYGMSFSKNLPDEEIAKLLQNFIKNTSLRTQTALLFQNRVRQHFSAEAWIEKHKNLYHSFLSLEV